MKIHSDFTDFILSLKRFHVEFMLVGAFNLAFLGFPRFTGDMDIWIRPTAANAQALIKALENFGMKTLGIKEEDIIKHKCKQRGSCDCFFEKKVEEARARFNHR